MRLSTLRVEWSGVEWSAYYLRACVYTYGPGLPHTLTCIWLASTPSVPVYKA